MIYPYVVEGGFTVVSKSPDTGLYDAHFGMILTDNPTVCHAGYEGTDTPAAAGRQQPADERGRPLHRARRRESNARGAQNAPRAPGAAYRRAGRGVVRPGDRAG